MLPVNRGQLVGDRIAKDVVARVGGILCTFRVEVGGRRVDGIADVCGKAIWVTSSDLPVES